MSSHLEQARITDLVDAFMSLPGVVYDPPTRAVLFGGIHPNVLGLLNAGLPSRLQLFNDLGQMNGIERLADGSVPIAIWLKNAADLSSGTESAKVFQRALDTIAHGVTGAPRPALPAVLEKVVHEDDMLPFNYMEAGVSAARAVAKLMVPRFENGAKKLVPDPVIYLGTGWLLSDGLLVTNHHVVNARNANEAPASHQDLVLQAGATVAKFDYDRDGVAGIDVPVKGLEAWDPALDYAVLRIAPIGRPPLRVAPAPLTKPSQRTPALNVIQHPNGGSKKFAIRNNLLSRASAHETWYFSDTAEGSSGAPVLDDTWNVVALHRGATFVDGVQFQGRSTAWVNVGTPVHAILEDLRKRFVALAAELP